MVELSRRGLFKAGLVGLSASAVAASAPPVRANDRGLEAGDTASMRRGDSDSGSPWTVTPQAMYVAEDTSIEIEWGDIPSNEEVTTNFDIRPTNGDWETMGSYTFEPEENGSSRVVTPDELFPDGHGDLTDHSEIALSDFAITPAVDPPCIARTFDARVVVEASSLGSVGGLTDSFVSLFVLDSGQGYNLGSNFGLRWPDFSRLEQAVDFDDELSAFPIQVDSYAEGVEQLTALLEAGSEGEA